MKQTDSIGVDAHVYARVRGEWLAGTSPSEVAGLISRNRDLIAIPATVRTFESYQSLLGFKSEQLGNVVMDLGSGIRNVFARSPQNIGRTIISLNPQLVFSQDRAALQSDGPAVSEFEKPLGLTHDRGLTVAARAEAFPFQDNTFDSIVSTFAVPYYSEAVADQAGYNKIIHEIVRVLKPDGTLFAAPITDPDMLNDALDSLPDEASISAVDLFPGPDYVGIHMTK